MNGVPNLLSPYTSQRRYEPNQRFISVDKILKVGTEHFGFSMEEMSVRCRKREMCYCRHVMKYILCHFTRLSLKSIGELFDGQDHTTVIHSCETVEDLIATNDQVFHEINEIIEKILAMDIKVTSEKDAVKMAAQSTHILNNLRNASRKYEESPGFETRTNKRRWEEIADAFLKKVSASEPTDNFESVKIILTNEFG